MTTDTGASDSTRPATARATAYRRTIDDRAWLRRATLVKTIGVGVFR